MIKIKSITMKNFLSIGNVSQAVNLDSNDIVLVLGENLDMGGNDSRNGCGKTTILNGLSFALFGEPLTKIKISNLINKVNNKHMLVSVIFEKNGKEYKIERGRKPDVFYFGDAINDDSDAQGESRITQQEIDKIIGLNHLMFKHIIALNTYTTPFLSSSAGDQREIIESLLGISTLSEKAETLKNKIKDTKQEITNEQNVISNISEYNEAIQKTANNIVKQKEQWDLDTSNKLSKHLDQLQVLMDIDIETEIENHYLIKKITDDATYANNIRAHVKSLEKELSNNLGNINSISTQIDSINKNVCFNCNQAYHGDSTKLDDLHEKLVKYTKESERVESTIRELNKELSNIPIQVKPPVSYSKLEDALEHKHSIKSLEDKILYISDEKNPYDGQLIDINAELKEVDYTTLNDLTQLKDHQEFLLKLLTNKDSFIRKKIINQNITFLNMRLDYYLNKLGMQHKVTFLSDLDVEISYLGKDLDFDNLSRGERTRLILALSFSFRDAYEALNDKINLLFVDELIDTGLDPIGVELSLSTLKSLSRDTNRSIFLISHRDELIGRIDTVLKVIKENGFTSFEQ